MKKSLLLLLFVAGVVGVVVSDWIRASARASRNSGGTYTLPAGNPVVSGTTISSTVTNNTNSDIATEITNSLDRTGRGGMLAAMRTIDGTNGSPALSFTSETGLGFYRNASHDFRLAINGSDVHKFTSAGETATNPGAGAGLTITGGTSSGGGISATGGTPNGAGLIGAGTGTGAGGSFSGGSSNGNGINSQGTGTGAGGSFTGGASNGSGVVSVGTGTGYGGYFSNGTNSTAGTPQDAVVLVNGNLDLDGVANTTDTVAMKNRLTPKNVPKAWVIFSSHSGGTLTDGFNVASVATNSTTATVTFAQAMASANYAINCNSNNAQIVLAMANSSGSVAITGYNPVSLVAWNPTTATDTVYCVVFGAQ